MKPSQPLSACKYCYGKGYASVFTVQEYHGDFEGDGGTTKEKFIANKKCVRCDGTGKTPPEDRKSSPSPTQGEAVQSQEGIEKFMETECTDNNEGFDVENHPHKEYWCCSKCLGEKLSNLQSRLSASQERIRVLEGEKRLCAEALENTYDYLKLLDAGDIETRNMAPVQMKIVSEVLSQIK